MALSPIAALAPIWLLLARPWPLSPPVPPLQAPEPCAAAEFHQFDFWLGDWDWFDTALIDKDHGTMHGGTNVVSINNGCALMATFSPWSLAKSTMIAHFDRRSRRWRMVLLRADGVREDYEGGLRDGKMVMTGVAPADNNGAGKLGLLRMTWSRLPEGAVRSIYDMSNDEGKTWSATERLDFTYWPKPVAVQ